MKKFFSFLTMTIVASCFLLSCKKETVAPSPAPPDTTTTGNVAITSTAGFSSRTFGTDIVEETVELVTVKLEGGVIAKTDLAITLQQDASLITAYNTANTTNYIVMPASAYQLPDGLTVTIPKNASQAVLKVKLIKSAFDFTKKYALAFTIAGAPAGLTTSTATKNIVVAVDARNKFDGLWTMSGTLTDVANPALTAWPNATIALRTTGLQTVELINKITTNAAWLDMPLIPVMSGAALSVYTDFGPIFTFNSSNNITAVINNTLYGNPAPSNTRAAVIDASGLNNYSESGSTKTIKVKFIMTQSSVIPTPPHHRSYFDMTLTYTGPR